MYHTNPAVIKFILATMPSKDLEIHMRYIRRQATKTEPGTNRHLMFVRLYQYCMHLQQQRLQEIYKRHTL